MTEFTEADITKSQLTAKQFETINGLWAGNHYYSVNFASRNVQVLKNLEAI